MSEPINNSEPTMSGAEQAEFLKWAAYNAAMAVLFAERDTHPVGSPERTAVTERILTLWWVEG